MQQPIIILGTGRCGSTLLQRILNTSEDITIWGEHAGFISQLADSYYKVTASKEIEKNYYTQNIDSSILVGELKDYQACPNWINSFTKDSVRHTYQQMLIGMFGQKLDFNQCRWGFKEIRYSQKDRALDMWLELFPNTSIILSVRNPFDVIKSMIIDWSDLTVIRQIIADRQYQQIESLVLKFAHRWQNVMQSFVYWRETKKLNCHVEKYEELLRSPERKIQQVFDFVNVPLPNNALKPMSFKIGSKKQSNLLAIPEIIYDLKAEIWQIVGECAAYFGYQITDAENLKLLTISANNITSNSL